VTGPFYFAWAGGAVQDQITLVTTGSTHGASAETASIVGDTTLNGSLLINLVNAQLEVGGYYKLSGPNIADGTYFQFDDSILSGPPGSLVLSDPATLGATSQTFTATSASIIGAAQGTLLSGSNILVLAGINLAAGIYAIAGTGIGETDTPVGVIKGSTTTTNTTTTGKTPVMIVGSALLDWDGTQGTMFALVATSTTTLGTDASTGMQTQKVAYSVARQDVRATSTGDFAILITGFPDINDRFLIDDIPTGVLTGLEPGLVYNINGNGIPLGATFIAPNGGTEIEIDQEAEGSTIAGVVTITGPRAPTEPFSPTIHNHNDEDLLSIEIEEHEGSFPTLNVTLKNPGIGLLAAGRSLWCWLSWDQAWTPAGTNSPDLVPLFNGRLVGAPRRQAGEIVTLQFLARPDDFSAQKHTLTESMKVLPYYDPVWLSSKSITPDTVLEAYSALFHVDPVTLAVTISDILEGEDGIVEIGEDQAIYEAFDLSYGPPPLDSISISGTVTWNQQAEGFIDITPKIVQAFKDAGSPYGKVTTSKNFSLWAAASRTGSTGGLISCVCGDGLLKDWPKAGTSIGGGWSLATLNDSDGIPLCYIDDATKNGGGWLKNYYYNVTYAGQDQTFTSGGSTSTLSSNVQTYEQFYGQYSASFPLNVYVTRMTLQFKANRKRTETVSAVLTAGVQRILSDSSEQDRAGIAVSSQYVGEAVDIDGSIPIGNLAYRSYFQTTRGDQSWQHLLLLARAKMRLRARAVDIQFGVDWRTALTMTLRHSAQYTDRRVPGGFAVGKVKSRKLCVQDGKMYGTFIIGCAAGTGDVLVLADSINSYVDTDYVSDGYQTIIGQVPLNDDIGYQALTDFSILDDGLDLGNMTADNAVNECAVTNGLTRQVATLAKLQNTVSTVGTPLNTMTTIQTTVTLDCKPVTGGGFHTDFLPDVAPLALPKLIDLSAASQ
jgi:hypothetical protein